MHLQNIIYNYSLNLRFTHSSTKNYLQGNTFRLFFIFKKKIFNIKILFFILLIKYLKLKHTLIINTHELIVKPFRVIFFNFISRYGFYLYRAVSVGTVRIKTVLCRQLKQNHEILFYALLYLVEYRNILLLDNYHDSPYLQKFENATHERR